MALLHKGWVKAAASLKKQLEVFTPLTEEEKKMYRLALEPLREAVEQEKVSPDGPEFWAIYFPLRKFCEENGERPHTAYLGALVHKVLAKAGALPDWYNEGKTEAAMPESPDSPPTLQSAERPVHEVLSGMVGEYKPDYSKLPKDPALWRPEHFVSPREYFLAKVAAARDGKIQKV